MIIIKNANFVSFLDKLLTLKARIENTQWIKPMVIYIDWTSTLSQVLYWTLLLMFNFNNHGIYTIAPIVQMKRSSIREDK